MFFVSMNYLVKLYHWLSTYTTYIYIQYYMLLELQLPPSVRRVDWPVCIIS